MLSPKVCHIFGTERPTNFRLGTQGWWRTNYPHHRQAPRSKVKVGRSRGASDRCWPISRERNVIETPKLVGRLPIPPATMAPVIRSKDQRSRSPGRLIMRPKVCHIFRIGRPTKSVLVHRWSPKTRITRKRHDLQG